MDGYRTIDEIAQATAAGMRCRHDDRHYVAAHTYVVHQAKLNNVDICCVELGRLCSRLALARFRPLEIDVVSRSKSRANDSADVLAFSVARFRCDAAA